MQVCAEELPWRKCFIPHLIYIGVDSVVYLRLKYTFGPYFCQNYSIWFLFSLFVQFGPRFGKIAFN